MTHWIANLATSRPRTIYLFVALLTLGLGLQIPSIRIDTDPENMLPQMTSIVPKLWFVLRGSSCAIGFHQSAKGGAPSPANMRGGRSRRREEFDAVNAPGRTVE